MPTTNRPSAGTDLVPPKAAEKLAPGEDLDARLGTAGPGRTADEDAPAPRMLFLPGPQALEVVARRAIGRLHFHRHLGVAENDQKVTATKSG